MNKLSKLKKKWFFACVLILVLGVGCCTYYYFTYQKRYYKLILKLNKDITKYQVDSKALINGVLMGEVTKKSPHELELTVSKSRKVPKNSTFSLKTISIVGKKRLKIQYREVKEPFFSNGDTIHIKLVSSKLTGQKKKVATEGKKIILKFLKNLGSAKTSNHSKANPNPTSH
jgi:ABC-type transporter Mla subunit MlaD